MFDKRAERQRTYSNRHESKDNNNNNRIVAKQKHRWELASYSACIQWREAKQNKKLHENEMENKIGPGFEPKTNENTGKQLVLEYACY